MHGTMKVKGMLGGLVCVALVSSGAAHADNFAVRLSPQGVDKAVGLVPAAMPPRINIPSKEGSILDCWVGSDFTARADSMAAI